MTSYLLEKAYVDGAVHDDVLVEIEAGRFTSVTLPRESPRFPGSAHPGKRRNPRVTGDSDRPERLPGLSLPGFANAHSHAFHRALRGRSQGERGSFWTWREQMYAVARGLDPDLAYDLAHATYRELAAAGTTTVGEFHYLHHQLDGRPYADPNAMAHAHIAAARDAGIRIALLDTCYLAAGIGEPPAGVQVRFSDGDAERWAVRATALADAVARGELGDGVRVGAAVHSVRAVPRDQLAAVADWASGDRVLHVHLSEQPAENRACLAAYGLTPAALLAEAGVWGPRATAVHATHLTDHDIGLLGRHRVHVALCPTTERDLADGIGPARALRAAGSPLTLGSDSHAVVDPFEEMRAVEMHDRLTTGERGRWADADLLAAATAAGHASLGFPDAGRIAAGQRADLVTLDLESPRTAGTGGGSATVVYAATAADVRRVMVDGRVVVGRPESDDAESDDAESDDAESDDAGSEEIGRHLARVVERVWKRLR